MTEITTVANARKAREARLDEIFASAVSKVEKEMRNFVTSGEADAFTVTVPMSVRDRIIDTYSIAGWVVEAGTANPDLLRIAFPAPVAGVHPERRQAGGAPVLDFWRFVYERQAIWHRRVELEQPRPWTDDPVLRDRFFTNIFRDLDPGTERAIVLMCKERPAWERLWNLLVYRRFNREDTWEKALGYLEFNPPIDLAELREILRQRYRDLAGYQAATNQPIFTDAHQVYPMPMIPGPDLPSRFFRVMLDVTQPNRQPDSVFSLVDKLGKAKTRKEAYRAFVNAGIPGISSFLSWQLTMDCTYGPDPIVKAEDDWAPIATGARFGAIMWYHWPRLGTVNYPIEGWPSLESVPPKELETFVKGMRDEQEARFEERGLDFAEVSAGRRLDMPALEHALCEYSKYVAASVGLPTRDRWSQPVIQGAKAAPDKKVQALAAKMDDAIKAIDLPGLKPKGGYRTKSGKVLTDDEIQALADEAEAGYDVSHLTQSKIDTDDKNGEPAGTEGAPSARGAAPPGEDASGSRAAASEPSGSAPLPAGGAEARFRAAIRAIDGRGEEPTPKAIFAELGGTSVSLNSRQAQWRRDELAALGYVKQSGKYVKE